MSRGLIDRVLNKVLDIGVFKTLLWTNTSSAAFAAKTIPLSLSSYDYVEIWFDHTALVDPITPNPVCVSIGYIGSVIMVHQLGGAGVNENTGVRGMTASTTGVTFTDYKYKNRRSGGNQTTLNTMCIPTRIYGVKVGGGS